MSSTSSTNSQKAPASLVKSIGYLPTAIIKKLTGSDQTAPLFISTCVEDEELEDAVELACGHILYKNDTDKAKGARIASNSLLANLSIFEATRCPICESETLANKDIGSESDLDVAEKYMTLDRMRELCGLERQSDADEQSLEEREISMLLEPSTNERLDMGLGETLMEVCRRAKRALSVKGAGGSRIGSDGA